MPSLTVSSTGQALRFEEQRTRRSYRAQCLCPMSPRKHAERVTAQVSSDHPVRRLWHIIKASQSKGDVRFYVKLGFTMFHIVFPNNSNEPTGMEHQRRFLPPCSNGEVSRSLPGILHWRWFQQQYQQWNSGIGHQEQQFKGTALASPLPALLQGANTFADLQKQSCVLGL